MAIAKVFMNNRSQAVRMPAEARFGDEVTSVTVRVVGKERILSPTENSWDSFFEGSDGVSDDFLAERSSQIQSERESFD